MNVFGGSKMWQTCSKTMRVEWGCGVAVDPGGLHYHTSHGMETLSTWPTITQPDKLWIDSALSFSYTSLETFEKLYNSI